jgi:hypothetical protein
MDRADLLPKSSSVNHHPYPRSRRSYAVALLVVIASGLLWRSPAVPLPAFYSKYGGDALWALLVFLGFGFTFARASTLRVTLSALCFSFVVEFSQLYQAPWIQSVRSTRLGALVLGATFNWPDLIAYAAGITAGCLAEILLHRFKSQSR